MDFEAVKGVQFTDTVTGFTGKVTAVAYYLDGYISVKLESIKKDGSLSEEWFSHTRLKQ